MAYQFQRSKKFIRKKKEQMQNFIQNKLCKKFILNKIRKEVIQFLCSKRVIFMTCIIMVWYVTNSVRSRDKLGDHVLKLMKLYIYDNKEADVLPARKLLMKNELTIKCLKGLCVETNCINKTCGKNRSKYKCESMDNDNGIFAEKSTNCKSNNCDQYSAKKKDAVDCKFSEDHNSKNEKYFVKTNRKMQILTDDLKKMVKKSKETRENKSKHINENVENSDNNENMKNVYSNSDKKNNEGNEKPFIYKPKHPVIIIPGISSTNLELWDSTDINFDFRKNVWGSFGMIINRLLYQKAWIKSLMLDPNTGLDPIHSKVRPANGFSSSDYILPGYWVWQKILHNLGVLGYDQTNLHVSSYDWRLSPKNLNKRDKYFERLKLEIEMYYKLNNSKVAMLCHSLGSITFFYFMNWVESIEKGFINKYIQCWITLAAPFLGCPKSVSGLLSGESLSTSSFFEGFFHDFVIKIETRRELLNSWSSIKTLLPKGGKAVWGEKFMVKIGDKNYDVEQIIDHLLKNRKTKRMFNINRIAKFIMGADISLTKKEIENPVVTLLISNKTKLLDILKQLGDIFKNDVYKNNQSDEYQKIFYVYKVFLEETNFYNKWIDPLQYPLPDAPDMKIYSIYGVGKKTERAYYYNLKNNKDRVPKIDTKINGLQPMTQNGVVICDGDGTVPTISCGYMSYRGWKNNAKLNPSNIKTYTREYDHKTDFKQFLNRGGPETSEHVDILGNYSVTEDILRIVCGEELNDRICSNIEKKSDKIDKRLKKRNQI